ncbi:MAG: hypothetical protein KGQ81_08590, partial [Cyanobacteria bacterium REEB498]|nr:hypothetical protein [Cyanobacteria bacterium REEB498]
MASKRTLNAKNLEALGAPTLAALLIELSSGQAVMQRRLRLALAAADGAAVAAQEVRKRLAAIARSTTFVDARKRKALLADLQAQHQAISGPIAAADPAQAWQLLLRYLELAEGVLERSSDGTGALAGAFAEALQDLAPLAVAAGLKPEALVEPVIELIAANGYGQFDDLIPAVAPALGEPGLAMLQRFYEQNGGPDATLVLLQVAELRGDVDAYLAQFTPRQLAQPLVAADVAPLLLEAGRAEQALALLDGAAANVGDWQLLDWGDARIAVLEALRRRDDAQQQRWDLFARCLSIPHLRAYLQRLDDFSDAEAEEQALQIAAQHPKRLPALAFLVQWPALPRAARLVLDHREHWDGDAFEVLAPAAERLAA